MSGTSSTEGSGASLVVLFGVFHFAFITAGTFNYAFKTAGFL
jgi:hypothetical protein